MKVRIGVRFVEARPAFSGWAEEDYQSAVGSPHPYMISDGSLSLNPSERIIGVEWNPTAKRIIVLTSIEVIG